MSGRVRPAPVASIREVAADAGVSLGTVSNVLNHPEKVLPRTVDRVLGSIERLGFIRNDAARQLRDGRSHTVGLVVLDVGNPFFTDLARGAEDAAARAGLALTLGNSDESAEREAVYLDLFEQQRVHGVLISPLRESEPRLRRLRARGIPAVLVDRSSEDPGFSSVSVDDVAGGRMAVQHLLARGRRRIAFAGGPDHLQQVADRAAGARQAVAAVPGARLETVGLPALSVEAGRGAGELLLARPAAARPDAVFAANDLVAMGMLQALMAPGSTVTVPTDLALIGYDDIAFAGAAVVPLSSVHQPSALIGSTAVEILLAEAADVGLAARQVVLQPELVVRRSTGG